MPAPVLITLPPEFSQPAGELVLINPFRVDSITCTPATGKPGSIIKVHTRTKVHHTATLDEATTERVLGELLAAILPPWAVLSPDRRNPQNHDQKGPA